MKVLVLGGTGWLGHHIARQLHQAGHQVVIASRGRRNNFAAEIADIPQITVDKTSEKEMPELLQQHFDAIIDSVPQLRSIELIHRYAADLKHYIHCSSTGGYSPLPYIPADENCPYGGFGQTAGWSTKVQVDSLALKLAQDDGFPATIIRPTYITGIGLLPLDNLGGRRQDYLSDIQHEKSLDVPDNGQALLQPVEIEDLAHAFVLALNNAQAFGQVYNISSKYAVTLQRYHEITACALGTTPHLNYLPVAEILQKYAGQIDVIGLQFLASHMCFTIAKAQRELGYQPHYTPEEAIEKTARWGILPH